MRQHITTLYAVLGFLAVASIAKADLADGLVLYLPFDEGQGKEASDLSGKKHHGKIEGAAWTNGKFGKALKFNGQDNFVEVPFADDFKIAKAISLGAWVTANIPFNPEWKGIINARKSSYGPFLLQTGGGGGNAELGLFLQGAWTWLRTAKTLEAKAFHHVVGTYDLKNGMQIYYDGALDNGAGSPGAKPGAIDEAAAEGVVVGHNYNFAGRFWDGAIDEVVIYNRALTAEEVAQLYKAPPVSAAVNPAGKLTALWATMKNEGIR